MNNTPCKECEERQIGCHSSCEKYKNFLKIRDEKNAFLHREPHDYYVVDKIRKKQKRMEKKRKKWM